MENKLKAQYRNAHISPPIRRIANFRRLAAGEGYVLDKETANAYRLLVNDPATVLEIMRIQSPTDTTADIVRFLVM